MELYSVGAGVSVGNELSKNARDQNSFRIQQNAMLVENATNTLRNDKQDKKDDTEFKVGMDSYGGAEAIGSVVAQYNKGFGQMALETADNFRSVGNKLASVVKTTPTPALTGEEFLAESGRVMGNRPQVVSLASDTPPVLKPADVGFTTAEDVSKGMAEGLSVGKKTFDGVAEAGGVSRFLLNRVGGVTSELGLEVGGKALGGVGGAISAGQDITNLVDTGHIFKKGESGWSEAGNITSMIGAGLDMASIAVPILAPLALATNVFSAVAGTIGTEQDDKATISKDSAPPPQQPLSVHPAWSSVGMVASVHSQPQIT